MNQIKDRAKGLKSSSKHRDSRRSGTFAHNCHPVREPIAGVARPHPGDMIESSDWCRRKAHDHGSQRIAPYLRE